MATPPLVPIVAGQSARTSGSHNWNDRSHTGVKEIVLAFGDAGILFFRVVYVDIDQTIQGTAHGTSEIGQNFPGEYLTNVSGYIKPGDTTVVRSLTFKTNRETYGPYGAYTPNPDIPFDFTIDCRFRIAGFGEATGDEVLNVIGVNISQ